MLIPLPAMLTRKSAVVVLAAALLLSACSPAATQPAQTSTTNLARAVPTSLPTRAVSATTSVAADGELALAAPEIPLSSDLSARVAAVNVTPGQTVKKGDVLMTVDDTSLQDAVADAQLALDLVKANIQVSNAPATSEDVAAAKASLSAAYVSYSTTKAGTTQSELDSAKASVDAAWLAYLAAQSSRDLACGSSNGLNSINCQTQEASYGNAFESWVSARDSYQKLLEPVSQNTLTQAYSSVASAKAKLDTLQAGVSDEQAKVDAAQITQSEADLATAQANLAEAKLVSPCDCTVQAVNVAVGVIPTSPAFTLVDLSHLQFKTTNLTERDVASIKVGAATTIRLKAYTQVFSGKVAAVLAQSSGTQSGEALYTVLIDLDLVQQELLPGMTGQADITLS